MTRPRFGFTLIELLVVIGIIALLIGILSPALATARKTAQATKCRALLKQLGTGWAIYADAFPDAMPPAVSMPTAKDIAPPNELTIMKVLKPHVPDPNAYECPSDDREYFATYGTSYEYLPGLAIALNPSNAVLLAAVAKKQPDIVPILSDGAEFHEAPADIANANLTVYYDAHVDWLFDSIPPNPLETE